MIDIVAQARMDDPNYRRINFIIVPTVSEPIPVGCEDISNEYFMQVEAIVEDL